MVSISRPLTDLRAQAKAGYVVEDCQDHDAVEGVAESLAPTGPGDVGDVEFGRDGRELSGLGAGHLDQFGYRVHSQVGRAGTFPVEQKRQADHSEKAKWCHRSGSRFESSASR